jgi:small-conductance mechanosensitive channel
VFDLDNWQSWPIAQNSPTAWLVAGGITLGVLAALLLLRPLIRRYAEKLRTTEQRELLEIPALVLCRTTLPFLVAVSLYFGLQSLKLGEGLDRVINSAITITVFIQFGLWAGAAVRAWVQRQRTTAADRAAVGSLGIISFIAGVLIWALVLLAALDNLGVNITALVAGLGIGGVAVALALQNVLGDLFASLAIALDRPFVVGDFLAIDNFLGSVENIGIKTTRLRSLDGEQIVFSNSNLLSARVRNYGRMQDRRVVFATNVAYETPMELVEKIPALLRQIVEAEKDTRFDRAHFAKHGVASLEFETVYFVLTADFNRYMDIQQSINFKIHRQFLELGIPFASPTQRQLYPPPPAHEAEPRKEEPIKEEPKKDEPKKNEARAAPTYARTSR